MARAGIVFGLILCGITFAGLVGTPAKTPMQFYPMMLGIPILFCGVVALNPHRRRHAMLAASTIASTGAVLGALWSSYQMIALSRGGTAGRYALGLMAAMTLVCIVFVAFTVVGFAKLKRRSSRREQDAANTVRLPSSSDKIMQDSDVPTSREIA